MASHPARVVLVTDVPFWNESKGSERRVAALVRFLSARVASIAVAHPRAIHGPDVARLAERFPRLWVYGPNQTAAPGGALPPLEQTHCGSGGLAPPAFVDAVLQAERPNAVLVEYVRLTHYVEHGDPNLWSRVFRVLDTHDVMHRRAEVCRARGSQHFLDITREQEARALSRYDLILAIQDDERAELEQLTDRSVLTIHHAHELRPIDPRAPDGVLRLAFASAEDDSALISLGTFLERAWPGVLEACAGAAELRLYGRLCDRLTPEVARMPGVRVRGFVADADDIYRECDAVVNLVEFGSGLKIKSVEALCHRRALITTPEGATGLPRGSGIEACMIDRAEAAYVLCRGEEAWARAIAALARDPALRERLAARGHDLAGSMFDEHPALTPLLSALEAGAADRGVPGPPANEAGRRAAIERARAIRSAVRGGFIAPINGASRPLPIVFSLTDLFDRSSADVQLHGQAHRMGTRAMTIAGMTRRALVMPPPAAAEFTLDPGPLLVTFAVGLLEECWEEPRAGPARFVVFADDHPVFSWDMDPRAPADRAWHGHRVYIPEAGREPRRVRLATFGIGGDDCRWCAWAEPTAVVLTPAVAQERAWHAPAELAPPTLVPREQARPAAILRRLAGRVGLTHRTAR